MKNQPYPLYELPVITDLKDMVVKRAEETPDEICFTFPVSRDVTGEKTCKEFLDDINALGTMLYSLGYRNKKIAIMGENSYEWIVTFLACANGGNIAVPLDKELEPKDLRELMKMVECDTVFASKRCVKKFNEYDGLTVYNFSNFDGLISSGRQMIKNGDTEFIDYKVRPEKTAAIFFTSGTTGRSKAAMLSNRNIASDINSSCRNFRLDGDTLSVLPFHHTFGLITAVFMVFNYRHQVYIEKSMKNIQRDLKNVKPAMMFMVPLILESFYKRIMAQAQNEGKYDKLIRGMKISDRLLKIGIDRRKTMFSQITDVFGGNLDTVICGGAFLDEKYISAFRSWGVKILNGYGITECSPVLAVNRNDYIIPGSVGQVIDADEVKVADDGEILVKGANIFEGYYNDPKDTEMSFDHGWYHTGDLGRLGENNVLFITGRKKNLIILSNGENISAEMIEQRIYDNIPYVKEVVCYGEEGKITAEIYLDPDVSDAEQNIQRDIDNLNKTGKLNTMIGKVKLRVQEFEKTTTQKIKRIGREQKNDGKTD